MRSTQTPFARCVQPCTCKTSGVIIVYPEHILPLSKPEEPIKSSTALSEIIGISRLGKRFKCLADIRGQNSMKLQDELFKQSFRISPSITLTHPQTAVSLLLGFKNIHRDENVARNKAALLRLVEINTVMMVEVVGGCWYCPVAVFCLVRGRFQAQGSRSICGGRGWQSWASSASGVP